MPDTPVITALRRRLNRVDALAIALGGVIGVGVFRTTGLVLVGAGGFVEATVIWLVVGSVCLAGSLLYADLSRRVPEVGGPYAYVRVGFGTLPAFVYGWFNAGVAIPVRQASVIAVIGELLSAWWPQVGARPLAIAVLVVLTGLNLLGVHAGALVQRAFTSAKLATLVFVIGLAMVSVANGVQPLARIGDELAGASFAMAIAGVWYTYLGWQDVVLLAEEVHEPQKNLPFVLVATVLVVIVLYTALHVAVYLGLGGGAAAESSLPVGALAQHTLGDFGASLLSILMLSSMIGGAAEGLMVRPRMALALARDGLGPRWLATVGRRGAPVGALLANSAVVLGLVATGSFVELLPMLVFAQGVLGLFETTSYFAVRRARPGVTSSLPHPWGALPFIGANAALCVLQGFDDPVRAGLAVAVLVFLGLVGYAFLRGNSEPAA
jgi:APA family basic amino acid/polyamine antiporter